MKTKLIQKIKEVIRYYVPTLEGNRLITELDQAISQSKEELVDKVIELSSKYWIDKYVGTETPLVVNKVQFKKFILEDLNKK